MLIGLVGKPSAGKSTLFQAMTNIPVARASYPFTTIEPNQGVGYVSIDCVCKEFGVQCNPREGFCIEGKRFIPVKLLDVAGLVPGAHEGKGLGNAFLDDLREADVLILVVDCSGKTNEKGEQVEQGQYDPARDIMFLLEEIEMWIKGILDKHWRQVERKAMAKPTKEVLAELLAGLKISLQDVEKALEVCGLEEKRVDKWDEEDKMRFVKTVREIAKPIVVAANKMDLASAEENLKKLKERFQNLIIIPTSAEIELALKTASKKGIINYVPGASDFEIVKEVNEEQRKALEMMRMFLKKWKSTGVQHLLNTAVFDVLRYIPVFPGGVKKLADEHGNVLPDCFLMPPGSTARDFAYRIHSDLGERFIKAIDVRTRRALGGDYVLKPRDVLEIVFRR